MVSISTNSTNNDGAAGSSDTNSSTTCLEITAEQEFFLYELETTDSTSVGLVLRAIYDNGDVHKFVRALEKRIAYYDKKILKVCSYHYQGFLDSVKKLKNLNDKCNEIKEIAEKTNEFIQNDSKTLINKSVEIVRYRRLQRNANLAIDQISMCIPALERYNGFQKLIKNKKYLQALKALEDLEHNYFTELKKYRFAQFLTDSIEPMRNEIKKQSYSILTDFLENLRKVSRKIGEDATNHMSKKFKMFQFLCQKQLSDEVVENDEKNINNTESNNDDLNQVKQINKPLSPVLLSKNKLNTSECFNALDKIDFGPIHRCCQIFNVLGDKNFEEYYRTQRLNQINVLVDTTIKLLSPENYIKYLNEVIGFFILEDRIMQSQPTLITTVYKDTLWNLALKKVEETMESNFAKCIDIVTMLKMKEVILLFILTMKNYGYNLEHLYSLLQKFCDQYNDILMKEYCNEFEDTLGADNYTPISVSNEKEYKAVIEEFPVFKRSTLDQSEYPRKFPFSKFVPLVFTQAKNYLAESLKFMENLQLSQSEINDSLRRFANLLLNRWCGSLKLFVTSKKRSLIQLIQITINMGYLERSCEHLEQYISKIVNKNNSFVESSHLTAIKAQIFQDARSEVEQLIDEELKEKVSTFLDDANYDWQLTQSNGVASSYIIDLINFLKTTFTSFTNLPNVLAKHVCMQTCKYLADRLHKIFLDPEIKEISRGALDQFNLDVMQCEQFTSQCPVYDLDDTTLLIAFAHVRELLTLVMENDWTTYFAERGKNTKKYARVKASTAAALLEKLNGFEKKKSNSLLGIGRSDRQKLYDTILRNLRALND